MKTTTQFKAFFNRKLKMLFITCFLVSNVALAQWTEIRNDFPTSYDIIECPDNMTCFAAGDALIKTTDGGETWAISDNGVTSANAWYLECFDKDTCYMGSDKMYKTTDGGQNWAELIGYEGSLISWVNPQIGYTIYKDIISQIKIAKTTDYGKTWTDIPHNLVSGLNVSAGFPVFVSENIGHCVVLNNDNSVMKKYIYKTNDGGQTWIQKFEDTLTGGILGMQFLSEQIGYACSMRKILKTIDGGESWAELVHPLQLATGTFKALDFIDEDRGYVVGSNQTIIKTTDGGETWVDESSSGSGGESVSVPSMDTAFIAIQNIYRNSNADLLSIQDLTGNEIGNIYPNPTNDKFTVSLNTFYANMTLQLFDVTGKLVQTIPLTDSKTELHQDSLNNGTYIYKIIENNAVLSTGKILFQ